MDKKNILLIGLIFIDITVILLGLIIIFKNDSSDESESLNLRQRLTKT
jgi:hypothetical protein